MHTGYLNREEFGLDLFEAVRLFSSRRQVRYFIKTKVNDLSMTVEQRKLLFDDLTKREAALTVEILKVMNTLEPDDISRLLTEYEGDVA